MDAIVIGAGPAGLTVARRLHDAGRRVLVVEKSRGAGGRCCTRRTDHGRFDHGAPTLDLEDRTVVPEPRVSAFGRELADGLDVRFGARAASVRPGVVTLEDGTHWVAEHIAVCAPAPQAVQLLPDGPARAAAARAGYDPCWSVMAAFPGPLAGVADVVADTGPVRWAHREGARPGRQAAPERWTIQADAAWTEDRLEAAPDAVAAELLDTFLGVTGATGPAPLALVAHRWLYAIVATPAGVPCVLQEDGIGVAGDWCLGPRVQDALDAGEALSAQLLGRSWAATAARR